MFSFFLTQSICQLFSLFIEFTFNKKFS
jgi:hypothetical protein